MDEQAVETCEGWQRFKPEHCPNTEDLQLTAVESAGEVFKYKLCPTCRAYLLTGEARGW